METAIRTFARLCALSILAIAATYRAGFWVGTLVHKVSNWLAQASHEPLIEVTTLGIEFLAWIDRVLTPPEPSPEWVSVLGAEILSPDDLEDEIERYEAAPKPVARRKPARARKAKAAA